MKSIVKTILKCCIASFVAVGILGVYSKYLDLEIEKLYTEKEDVLSLCNGVTVKDKGNAWIKESAMHGNLILMGSSELSSPVAQNIKNNFPNDDFAGNISVLGHAYVQNGLHAMSLGANYKNIRSNDIVIIESIQWFFGDDISAEGFMSNFSELQFYEFLHNDRISYENRKYLCQRFLELEDMRTTFMTKDDILQNGDNNKTNPQEHTDILAHMLDTGWIRVVKQDFDYPQTHILATLYSGDSMADKILYQVMRPYFLARYELMKMKDKYETYNYLKGISSDYEKAVFATDWDEQLEEAENEGKSACTNNDIYVYDEYYTTYLADGWTTKKGTLANTSALVSREWDDYKFLLSVCNDLGLHPYIVNVSTNGYYYDYVGVDAEMRQQYYTQIESMAEDYGIDSYDELKNKEYEPYVFADVMHLGWKGWIYVTQAITEYFEQ